MPKYRKMLSNLEIPAIKAMMKIIPTQSKATLAGWTVSYAEAALIPLWVKFYPDDTRPQTALAAAHEMIAGKNKWNTGLNAAVEDCLAAAKDAEDCVVARTAARAVAQCCSTIHSGSHCLGLAFYGALALAYDTLGIDAPWNELEAYASGACDKMLAALHAVAVENEPKPCNVGWEC